MFNYQFFLLTPAGLASKKPELAEQNNNILDNPTLGIEVTERDLADRCSLGNIDPQHSEGRDEVAAIEEALSAELPPEGSTLATLRADCDAVGSMAILELRARGQEIDQAVLDRIRLIAEADKFRIKGEWSPQPLTQERLESDLKPENSPLAAIGQAVQDRSVDMYQKVQWMISFLVHGSEPEGYRQQHEDAMREMYRALQTGEIQLEKRGEVAFVNSQHRAGTSVGYSIAPVVIAFNPQFEDPKSGNITRKFTICQYHPDKFIDLRPVCDELSKLESGWGGNLTSILASPQGVGSELDIETVISIVDKYVY